MRARLVPAALVGTALLTALLLVPAALAGGPAAGVTVGFTGVTSPDGKVRYVALPAGADTAVGAVDTSDGHVLRFGQVIGAFGIPTVAYDQTTGGLSRDGRTLVVAQAAFGQPLRTNSLFTILDTRTMRVRDAILLKGDYTYDALSPEGRTLFLIHHVSAANVNRYVVRAYDLRADRLLPGRIADKTQPGWVMQGAPMTRAVSDDGRMVYTLYQNYGGYPFVHALDTTTMTAHCVGIPWRGNQDALWNMRLSLGNGGRTLAVHWRSGRSYLAVDTRTYRVSRPGGFPWALLLAASAGGLALAAALLLLLRRRRQHVEPPVARRLGLPEGDAVA
jgi:hypothetical protein